MSLSCLSYILSKIVQHSLSLAYDLMSYALLLGIIIHLLANHFGRPCTPEAEHIQQRRLATPYLVYKESNTGICLNMLHTQRVWIQLNILSSITRKTTSITAGRYTTTNYTGKDIHARISPHECFSSSDRPASAACLSPIALQLLLFNSCLILSVIV